MLLSEASVLVAGLAPVYARVADALGVPPDQLNLEGACVVGEALRWFQRGLPSAGAPTRQRRRRAREPARAVGRRPGRGAVSSAVRRYDLGSVAGVGLAVTDAVALPNGLVLVSAAAEDSPSTYDDGPVVGSALALLDGDRLRRPGRAAAAGRRGRKVEGLALAGHDDRGVDLAAVVDADDPAVPSLLLELRCRPLSREGWAPISLRVISTGGGHPGRPPLVEPVETIRNEGWEPTLAGHLCKLDERSHRRWHLEADPAGQLAGSMSGVTTESTEQTPLVEPCRDHPQPGWEPTLRVILDTGSIER